MSDKNLQRRSFFTSLFGAAAVTAVAVEAKPAPVADHTVGVRSHGYYVCGYCERVMVAFHNHTMRCTEPQCPNYDKPLRMPLIQAQVVNSDEEELIRHAMILTGVIYPGMEIPKEDFKLCSEVVARMVLEINADETYKLHGPYDARCIRPSELAQELMPYYGIAPRT